MAFNLALQSPDPTECHVGITANQIFDNLTRSLGNGISRRQAFGLFIKSLVAVALTEIGIRTTWADGTCLCNGQTYDPTSQCCVSGTVVTKHPIANTAQCPNKVPNQGHATTCSTTPSSCYDGCGSKTSFFSPDWLPQGFLNADFSGCCNNHDLCYSTCNASKATGCDLPFLRCMSASCVSSLGLIVVEFPEVGIQLLGYCAAMADLYYAAVALGGGTPFEAAQSDACDCCPESTCPQSCAGSICGSLPACAGGGDCVCFTDTEGNGACVHGSTPCAGAQTCATTADCPAGSACLHTSCCGSFGVCGPLCNPVVPATATSAASIRPNLIKSGPTLGKR
jgi:group XII secretory phospholipase A2 precursor (PLA2G12)